MRAIRVFVTTLAFVSIVTWAVGAVVIEWTLRDVPRPAAPSGEPTLAHRGLACVSLPSQRGWLRSALIRHPGAETVASRHARSLKLKTLDRLFVEWALTVWLSRRYDDDQLARLAGDSVWLGRGAYGLDEGARAWFGRRLDRLSLAESALLVGLEPAPVKLDPTSHPTQALHRRQVVLRAWEVCGLVPSGVADELEATPVLEGVLRAPSSRASTPPTRAR